MPPPASNWRRLLLIQNFTCKLKLKRSLTELYISVIITLRKKLEMHWQNRNAFWTSNNNFHCNWYLQNKIRYYIYIYIYIYVSHTHVCCCCSCCCCFVWVKIQHLVKILRCCNFLRYTQFSTSQFQITKLDLHIWFEYSSIASFFRVLLWPVQDAASCGKYVQGNTSYISCARYITILY